MALYQYPKFVRPGAGYGDRKLLILNVVGGIDQGIDQFYQGDANFIDAKIATGMLMTSATANAQRKGSKKYASELVNRVIVTRIKLKNTILPWNEKFPLSIIFSECRPKVSSES